MKKQLPVFLVILSMIGLCSGCGSSGGQVGSSTVTITVGESGRTANITTGQPSFLAKAGVLLQHFLHPYSAIAAIPSDVKTISFSVSAPDMVTINRDVPISTQTSITESFTVSNGNNRLFHVEAKDASGKLLYRGERIINLTGTPVSIGIDMQLLTDVTPPVFSGLSSATAVSPTEAQLSWSPASDNLTTSSNVYYLVFISQTPGGQNYSTPSFTTSPGATSFRVTGLSPCSTYFITVKAVDERGNRDTTVQELRVTTMCENDTTSPVFSGLTSATASTSVSGQADLSWTAASDNKTSAGSIVYLVYFSTTAGGENYSSPANFTTSAGATSFPVSGLIPGTYYFVVRARDEAGNIDTNTVERAAVVTDITRPTITSVSPANGSADNPTTSPVTVNFSEAVKTSSVTSGSFSLSLASCTSACNVSGTIAVDGATATLTPSGTLAYNTSYTAMISSAVTDLAGNHLAPGYSWSFTTAPDNTPPIVNSVNLTQPLQRPGWITITFSEPMNSATISNPQNYILNCTNDCILGIRSIEAESANSVRLNLSRYYDCHYMMANLKVFRSVTDLAGNLMENDYDWTVPSCDY